MKLIKLDTTVAKKAVAELWKDDYLVAKSENDNPLSAIKDLLTQEKIELSSIDHFDANPGPGSFTGVRIGAAVANTLNWSLGNNFKVIEPIYD